VLNELDCRISDKAMLPKEEGEERGKNLVLEARDRLVAHVHAAAGALCSESDERRALMLPPRRQQQRLDHATKAHIFF
jgi:hypothetical protein